MAGGNNEIRERVARIETLIGAVPEIEDDKPLLDKVADLESLIEKVEASISVDLSKIRKDHTDLREEFAMLRRVVNIAGEGGEKRPKLKVPELKSFAGVRNSKELENFLWDMEQYFVAAHVPDTEKVTITSMYLSGDAKLWWRTRLADDKSAGRLKIESWERLKKEMKDQFLPNNSS